MLPTTVIQTGQDFDNFIAGMIFGICVLGLFLIASITLSKRN